ncbi:hypothetical protein Tco_1482382 [Tanacetum coccineum]
MGKEVNHNRGRLIEPILVNERSHIVEVLQKSLEELRQARTSDKDLLEKAKEDNKQYEEKLEVSFDNEGRNGERGECKDW